MIFDQTPCDADQVKGLFDYLMKTPVSLFVSQLFKDHQVDVFKAEIKALEELGEYYTIWSNLGGIRVETKYQIREAYEGLRKAKNANPLSVKNWECVNRYIALIGEGKLELVLTVMKSEVGLMFIDGNKRVIAFYEYHKERGIESINLPLYLLSAKTKPM